jgi:hypothetical protein
MSHAACEFAGPRQAREDEEAAGVSDGVAVQPSRRDGSGSKESCCSWMTGPVAASAAGDGGRQGMPSLGGAVWATRAALAARRSARTRRASDMKAVRR